MIALGLVGLGLACSGATELEWREENGYRWAELPVPQRGRDGFQQLSPSETGIGFTNTVTREQALQNEHLYNGSGVALGDVDGDGRTDIYFASLDGPNVLYRNLGNWRFEDVTEQAGVAAPNRFSTGAVFADADGDGDLDLFVTAMEGASAFFVNDGSGVFEERTEAAGLQSDYYGTTQALADVDGDGDLDLYVANNKVRPVRDMYPPAQLEFERVVQQVDGEYVVAPEFERHYRVVRQRGRIMRFEYAEPDKFYLNDGTGRFDEVSFTSGWFLDEDGRPLEETPTDWGLTARFHDIDDDGDPDLYVCNDFESPDRLWINDGTGRFRLVDRLALRAISNATMTIDIADIERDGDDDFILIDMLDRNTRQQKTQVQAMVPEPTMLGDIQNRPQIGRNTLLMSRGDGTFSEIATFSGVEASGWSWSVLFLDVDLDGYEDILIGTGHEHDFLDSDTQIRLQQYRDTTDWRTWRFQFPNLYLPNVAFHNEQDRTFTEVAADWGFADDPDVTQGAGTADLDNDGDLDVVANRLGFPAGVWRNESNKPRLAVQLDGRPPNTQGIGAKIRVLGGPVPEQRVEVVSGGRYVSGSDPVHSFAAGEADSLDLIVEWRSGTVSVITGAKPNRVYDVSETSAVRRDAETENEGADTTSALYRDVSAMLGHRHVDIEYDDFARQPLLRHKLSQLGPGVAWFDVDRDGDDDLFVSTGRGGTPAFFRNTGGRLRAVALRMGSADLDQTAILPLPRTPSGIDVLLAQMSYEADSPEAASRAPSVRRLTLATARRGGALTLRVTPAVPGFEGSVGPLAAADYDADGDLDVFVGGRVQPARYPQPVASRLFHNEAGGLEPDTANTRLLTNLGMVVSAVFSDVDVDGDPDLVLARDWGSLIVLINDDGRFSDRSQQWGLSERRSMWNAITTGDFDEDGLPDLVATSWGRNTRLRATPEHPLRMYYGDFDGNSTLDVLEARYEERLGDLAPIRGRQQLSEAIPFVLRRITSFGEYADATVHGVIGPALSRASTLDVNGFDHMLFVNTGGTFEGRPLHPEAQLSPSLHAAVADADGDGHEDLFLTQNFYPAEAGMPRYAAGVGLWLSGDGTGNFVPLSATQSGIRVFGDQRGAALADYDADGRIDIVISQNGNETKLYHNEGAAPGLRVRLVGTAANPDAVGALLRLVYADDRMGPARAVRSGAGHLSHDALVQVLGMRAPPTAVRVRWPGGRETTHTVPEGSSDVTIRMPAP
jgi:hypothetical protein